MDEKDSLRHLIGLNFLGNLALILIFYFFYIKPDNNWLAISVFIFIFSYYFLFIYFLSFYLSLFGTIIGGKLEKIIKWLIEKYPEKKVIFEVIFGVILLVVLFPIFNLIFNDWKKVSEIYIYIVGTGVISLLVIRWADLRKINDDTVTSLTLVHK